MTSETRVTDGRSRLGRLLLALVPLGLLVGLVAIFASQMGRDPNLVPSVLINQPAPQFALPPVEGLGLPGFDTAALKGEVSLVNVFASWCIPCRDEHPVLMALKQAGTVRIFGINQKDAPENARAFLAALGNPYAAVGADSGRVSIDWGVYGVPETFIVDANGVIVYKHIGPMSAATVTSELIPAIAKARGVVAP